MKASRTSSSAAVANPEKVRPERRSTPRLAVEHGQPVLVELGQGTGIVLNVSAGGLMVHSLNPLRVGSNIRVQMWLPNSEEQIGGEATIVWMNDDGQAGLKFVTAPPDWTNRMITVVSPPKDASDEPEAPSPDGFDIEALLREAVSGEEAQQAAPPSPAPLAAAVTAASATLAELIEQARSITDADGAAIALEQDGGVYCVASTGFAPAVGASINPVSGVSGECYRTGRLVVCDDAENDARVNPEVARQLNLRSLAVVPILQGDRVIGLLETLSHRRDAFVDVHVELLAYIAEQIAKLGRPSQGSKSKLVDSAETPAPAAPAPQPVAATTVAAPTSPQPPAAPERKPVASEAPRAPLPVAAAAKLSRPIGKENRPAAKAANRPRVSDRTASGLPGVPFASLEQPPREALSWTVIILLVVALLLGGWWWYQQPPAPPTLKSPPALAAPHLSPAGEEPKPPPRQR